MKPIKSIGLEIANQKKEKLKSSGNVFLDIGFPPDAYCPAIVMNDSLLTPACCAMAMICATRP